MNPHAHDFRKALAAAACVVGIALPWSQSWAEEPAAPPTPADTPVDGAKPRPIVVRTMTAGSLRNGQPISSGAGHAERPRAGQHEDTALVAQKRLALIETTA